MRTTLLAVICCLIASPTIAQVAFGGMPWGIGARAEKLPRVPQVVLPEVDAAQLIEEDLAKVDAGIKGPFRFGFNHVTDIRTERDGIWYALPNGDRVWRVAIHCPEAYAINLKFTTYRMPEGARLFVYNTAGQHLGAFTAQSSPGRDRMAVGQLPGDRVVIEYHEPAAQFGQGELVIGQVTHAYRDVFGLMRDLGDSGPCNINVICPEGDDWRDEIRTVAIITTGGNGFCTGTLMNNCAGDSIPYFLTAHHCLSDDVEDWVFRFNWDSPTCDPTENGPIDQTVVGCELLVDNNPTDMAFLRLSSIPPPEYNVNWAGWDKRDIAATSAVGIHHPSGDIKKISRTDGALVQADIDLGTGTADCWRVSVWDAGTTEPGSSGSALWNQDKRVVGQLYGGAANCDNSVDDYYGRLSTSWPLLEEYLGTCGDTLDGLNVPVVVPINWDAAVTSIVNVPALVCDEDTISPIITIKNNGLVQLNTVAITYQVTGQPSNTVFWTGTLQPGQTVNHPLPDIEVPSGELTLMVSSSAPNGNEDQVPENDLWDLAFVVSTPGQAVQFDLVLDDFGTDITWELMTDSATVIHSGGPYTDGDAGDTLSTTFCLTYACYTFTINDAFGDGICCENGEGSYTIGVPDGAVLVESDGQYGAQDVQEFCLEEVGVPESSSGGHMRLFPNPATGRVVLQLNGINGPAKVVLRDSAGRIIMQQAVQADPSRLELDLNGFAAGVYYVQVHHTRGRIGQRLILQR
jgi:lysyl endopeptidase